MAEILLIGCALVAATVGIHAVGSTLWLAHVTGRYLRDGGSWSSLRMLVALLGTVIFLSSLHVIQIVLWAVTYLEFVPDVLPTFEKAFYFSIVTFTTLGYGDITLHEGIRVLSGIESLSGILVVGWTTAVMYSVVQRAWSGLDIAAKFRDHQKNQTRSDIQ